MKARESELFVSYLLIDLVILNLSLLFIANINRAGEVIDLSMLKVYALHGNLSWIVSYIAFTKRNLFLQDSIVNRLLRITKRQVVFGVVAAVLAILFVPGVLTERFFVEYSVVFYISKIVLYWLIYKFLKYRRKKRISSLNTVIIGCNETGEMLCKIMKSNPYLGYFFQGYICNGKIVYEPFLGSIDDLEELIDTHQIQVIYFTISFFNGESEERQGKKVLNICNQKGVRLRFVPTNQRWLKNNGSSETIGDFVVLNPQEIPLDYISSRLQKRFFDLVFSSVVILLLFSWLYPIIALLIKIESPGKVLFKQKRTGVNNETFECYKFRSMRPSDDADTKQATSSDDRITRIGRFLRKSNLDELPQFFNVLKGDMSVVGPRPHMLKHTEEYSALIDQYLVRHYVKPGITGWAQVNGYRGETKHLSAMENRVKSDMYYIRNWTFTLDMKIIWRTIFSKSAWENAG